MEQFSCKTKILFGEGSIQALQDLKSKRLFLVTDPFFMKNGLARAVAAAAKGAETEIFQGVQPDPSVKLAAEGTLALKNFQPDTVVALGGGSALDCAKAMIYFSGLQVRFVAIPTTSGSGSEVTDFAILTHEQVKHPLVDDQLKPDLAILDSALLQKLPPSLVADTGFDVLSHAVEAYVAKGASLVTDALAQTAFSTVLHNLLASFQGDTSVRGRIHMASTMAGMAFSDAGLGLCHAMAHVLGGMYHLPHGRLNGILLPAVIRHNASVAGTKYGNLARGADLGGSADSVAVRNLIHGLIRLRQALNLPATLAQAGVDPNSLRHNRDKIVKAVLEDPCCRTNPVAVEDFGVRQILEAVTGDR